MLNLNSPYGSSLKNLLLADTQHLQQCLAQLPTWHLTPRQLCDLELLINGGFSPLEGFMDEVEYHSVVEHMQLLDKQVWPIPITLDVSETFAKKLKLNDAVVLRDPEENPLAILHVSSVWQPNKKHYVSINEIKPEDRVLQISGTEQRKRLQEGSEIPEWFSYPDIIQELRKTYPPRSKQGITLFFTGLSGAGKSTIANALIAKLLEFSERKITLLDGDIVRKNLSSELGFSKEHRDLNILRIGFVASEITKNGGIAVCAPIAPYAAIRQQVREEVSKHGGFIEIYISTPIETCEGRDSKGLYAKARKGVIKGFTGIDDPYEAPENLELNLDTSQLTVEDCIEIILEKLKSLGYI